MGKKTKKKTRSILASVITAVILVGLIIGYTKWSTAREINLQKVVFAKVDIPPRTVITEDMVVEFEQPGGYIPPNAIRNVDEVIGKWTATGWGISENSLIYKDKVVTTDEMPDSGTLKLNKDEVAFSLLVNDIEDSLGNSIVPDSYVDLYFKTTVKEEVDGQTIERPVFGKVADRIRVTAAKDAEAVNVFEGSEYQKEQATALSVDETKKRSLTKLYIFGVTPEQNQILNKGKLIGEIVPVVTGQAYDKEVGEREATTSEMEKWIDDQSYKVVKEEGTEESNG